MLSDTANVWTRLWLEGDPKEVDDDDRLLEEIASFLARGGDPPWRASARGRAAVVVSTVGASLGTCVQTISTNTTKSAITRKHMRG